MATTTATEPSSTSYFCGEVQGHPCMQAYITYHHSLGQVNGRVNYGDMTLRCNDPGATISKIDFAAFGTPTGTCGAYQKGYVSC